MAHLGSHSQEPLVLLVSAFANPFRGGAGGIDQTKPFLFLGE